MSTKSIVKATDCGLDGLTFTEPSLCKPHFADDCDLANIVRRFLKTGEHPQMVSRPTISDATNAPTDFFAAWDPVVKVRQAFDQLPIEERNRFNNNPEVWAEEMAKQAEKGSQEPSKASEAQEPLKASEAQEPPKEVPNPA